MKRLLLTLLVEVALPNAVKVDNAFNSKKFKLHNQWNF